MPLKRDHDSVSAPMPPPPAQHPRILSPPEPYFHLKSNEQPASGLNDTVKLHDVDRIKSEDIDDPLARPDKFHDQPCHPCVWASAVNKKLRLCEKHKVDPEMRATYSKHARCIPVSAEVKPLVEQMYAAHEAQSADSLEFARARDLVEAQLLADRHSKSNGAKVKVKVKSESPEAGEDHDAKDNKDHLASSSPRRLPLVEAASDVAPPRLSLVEYDSDSDEVADPLDFVAGIMDQATQPMTDGFNFERLLALMREHGAIDPNPAQPVFANGVRRSGQGGTAAGHPDLPFHPPHIQGLSSLAKPLRDIVRSVIGSIVVDYGAPDAVTRDAMLAVGISVAIQVARHIDPDLAVFDPMTPHAQ